LVVSRHETKREDKRGIRLGKIAKASEGHSKRGGVISKVWQGEDVQASVEHGKGTFVSTWGKAGGGAPGKLEKKKDGGTPKDDSMGRGSWKGWENRGIHWAHGWKKVEVEMAGVGSDGGDCACCGGGDLGEGVQPKGRKVKGRDFGRGI